MITKIIDYVIDIISVLDSCVLYVGLRFPNKCFFGLNKSQAPDPYFIRTVYFYRSGA